MYNIYDEFDTCKGILDNLDIPYAKNSFVKVNTRSKKRWGRCAYKNEFDAYEIQVNVDLLDERNSLNGLRSTILHELIHTCKDCMNHGVVWKQYASIVNANTAYKVKRTTSTDDKGIVYHRVNEHKPKYIISCPACGHEWYFERANKRVKLAAHCICPYCNTHGLNVTNI